MCAWLLRPWGTVVAAFPLQTRPWWGPQIPPAEVFHKPRPEAVLPGGHAHQLWGLPLHRLARGAGVALEDPAEGCVVMLADPSFLGLDDRAVPESLGPAALAPALLSIKACPPTVSQGHLWGQVPLPSPVGGYPVPRMGLGSSYSSPGTLGHCPGPQPQPG